MSWSQLVEALYGLRRFGIKPGLEKITRALTEQGHPDDAFEVITVAGTNGKGTVASMIAALLQAHGYRVGLYTSPHLIDVRERFRVDGKPLSKAEVEPVLRRFLAAYGDGAAGDATRLTFFEMTTLMGVELFAQQKVDVAVMEVGLGGRLDAVNAIEPSISVVTTIARDHMEYLGNEIADIAAEKAGIFRPGIPAVVGGQDFESAHRALLEAAERMNAEVIDVPQAEKRERQVDVVSRHRDTAKLAVARLMGDRFSDSACRKGFRCWRWPGRFETIDGWEGDRRLILDAAHNRAGLQALNEHLSDGCADIGAVIWTSMVGKDPGDAERFFDKLGVPVWGSLVENQRCRTSEQLQGFVPSPLWQGAASTAEVLREVRAQQSGDLLIFGSVFLVGEVYDALGWQVSDLVTYGDDCD